MNNYPTDLKRTDDDHLLIQWDDGVTRRHSFRQLRNACPCATCREKRKGTAEKPASSLTVLSLEEAQPLKIADMKPMGNYAYKITFSDGHDTGIFTLEFLRELADEPNG